MSNTPGGPGGPAGPVAEWMEMRWFQMRNPIHTPTTNNNKIPPAAMVDSSPVVVVEVEGRGGCMKEFDGEVEVSPTRTDTGTWLWYRVDSREEEEEEKGFNIKRRGCAIKSIYPSVPLVAPVAML